METPSLIIKIKGASAINALSGQGPVVGALKLKGVALGGAAATKLGEVEASRVIATKKGLLLYAAEVENDCVVAGKVAATKAAATKAAATQAMATKAALSKAVAAKSAVATTTGAALSAKSVGFSLGLGGLGPWLALGALGLAATGIYLYLRSQEAQDELPLPDELENPV